MADGDTSTAADISIAQSGTTQHILIPLPPLLTPLSAVPLSSTNFNLPEITMPTVD